MQEKDDLLMRTITRIAATAALSFPLALGLAGVASADTGNVNEPTVAIATQAPDEQADDNRGLNIDLNLGDLFGDNEIAGDRNDDGLLGDLLNVNSVNGDQDRDDSFLGIF